MITVREEVKEGVANVAGGVKTTVADTATAISSIPKKSKRNLSLFLTGALVLGGGATGAIRGAQEGGQQSGLNSERMALFVDAAQTAELNWHDPNYGEKAHDLHEKLTAEQRRENRRNYAKRGALRGSLIGLGAAGVAYGASKVFKFNGLGANQQTNEGGNPPKEANGDYQVQHGSIQENGNHEQGI